MLRTGVRFLMQERGNFEYAPHKSATFIKFSGCSAPERCTAREHNFVQNFQDVLHGGAISASVCTKIENGTTFQLS